MGSIISVLIVLLCVLLVFVILVQNPKGGGLSTNLGSANQFGGIKQTMDVIEKITWGLAIAIVVLSMVSSTMSEVKSNSTKAPGTERLL